MKKVYIVMQNEDYEGGVIQEVFSNLEAANSYIQKMTRSGGIIGSDGTVTVYGHSDTWEVEVWEIRDK
jgi:hypothetical protein